MVLHEMVAVKARGDRSSLHVTRRDPEECHSTRAVNGRACPRPYTQQEWEELRDQPASSGDSLIGQHVLQHSDGATAYAAIREGQKRDTVNHQCRNGGPYSTKVCNHTNADGSSFQALGGTQMLDAWFGQAKRRAQGIRRDYSDALDENIKESQWFHWVAGKDRWHEAAKVLQWVDAQEG